MAQQLINLGSAPNDGNGDTLRDGGDIINDNFTELYTDKADVVSGAVSGNLAELDVDGNLVDSGVASSTIGDKADKVVPGTTGDFAALDAGGNLSDSGYGSSDFLLHDSNTDLELAASSVTYGHIDDQAQTIAGVKTFGSIPVLPASDPTTDNQSVRKSYVDDLTYSVGIACSDETTDLETDTGVCVFRMPYAMTLTAVRASVTTAPTGSTLVVDINEGGSTILSTKLSIDASEKTSTTAATPPVISDSSLADDAEITIDIDQVGSTITGAGLKVTLIGTLT